MTLAEVARQSGDAAPDDAQGAGGEQRESPIYDELVAERGDPQEA